MATRPADPYETLAQRLAGRLIRRWTLHGGVSAKVQALDLEALALWELLVSSAALTFMDRWGLEPRVEAERRSKTRAFLDRAVATLVRRDGR
ncbi:hypothetical protein [Hyalangium gracile]|uniref:hypothetical protein n=1 Tax=Hyalangium gracile TaxID=394092 RepID=UPI001CCB11BB|nr:hypothetical protein [Hyalangium gracile]